jgi:hypothetical protein
MRTNTHLSLADPKRINKTTMYALAPVVASAMAKANGGFPSKGRCTRLKDLKCIEAWATKKFGFNSGRAFDLQQVLHEGQPVWAVVVT